MTVPARQTTRRLAGVVALPILLVLQHCSMWVNAQNATANGSIIAVAGNDKCAQAVKIDAILLPISIFGNTTAEQATPDFPNPTDTLNNLTCGIKPEARGVWYAITMSASAISGSSSSNFRSDSSSLFLQATVSSLHDAWLDESAVTTTDSFSSSSAVESSWGLNTALFSSESTSSAETCQEDALECVSTSDYALLSQRTSPTSQWFAEPGVTYYLHVTGISEKDTGAFNLQIMVRFVCVHLCIHSLVSIVFLFLFLESTPVLPIGCLSFCFCSFGPF
jgi:hypothetical protein